MNWKLITALWMREVGVLRDFYITYFGAKSNVLYLIKKTGAKSYFLSFDEETRLKLMGHSDIAE